MSNYTYRALAMEDIENSKNGRSIECRQKNQVPLLSFIKNSTPSRFISTTKQIGVSAHKYSAQRENARNKDSATGKRSPVIVVDTDRVNEQVYDCSSDEGLTKTAEKIGDPNFKKELDVYLNHDIGSDKKRGNSLVFSYCKADSEVIVENQIESDAYREIPPVLVDVLDALESVSSIPKNHEKGNKLLGNIKTDDKRNDAVKYIMSVINDMVMEDGAKDLMSRVDEIRAKFNPLEEKIMSEYYDKMNTMSTVSQTISPNVKGNGNESAMHLVEGVRTGIVRKIINDYKIQEIIAGKVFAKQDAEGRNDIGPLEMMDIYSDAGEYFVLPEGEISTTSSITNDANSYMLRNNMKISIKNEQIKKFPVGVVLKNEGKNAEINYRVLSKDTKGKKEIGFDTDYSSGLIKTGGPGNRESISINPMLYKETDVQSVETPKPSKSVMTSIAKKSMRETDSQDIRSAKQHRVEIEQMKNKKGVNLDDDGNR